MPEDSIGQIFSQGGIPAVIGFLSGCAVPLILGWFGYNKDRKNTIATQVEKFTAKLIERLEMVEQRDEARRVEIRELHKDYQAKLEQVKIEMREECRKEMEQLRQQYGNRAI